MPCGLSLPRLSRYPFHGSPEWKPSGIPVAVVYDHGAVVSTSFPSPDAGWGPTAPADVRSSPHATFGWSWIEWGAQEGAMSTERLLKEPEAIKALADNLSHCPRLTRFDKVQEPQAWTLAYAFSELEESFRKFLDEQLPKLTHGNRGELDITEMPHEIGEEFRHILYHINAPEFFGYLSDEGEKDSEE